MDTRELGLLLVGVAVVLGLIGLAIATGLLGWFGRLPGDLRIEGERVKVYVPLVSMLIASVVLTLILSLLRRIL
jgi:hypothetical protein